MRIRYLVLAMLFTLAACTSGETPTAGTATPGTAVIGTSAITNFLPITAPGATSAGDRLLAGILYQPLFSYQHKTPTKYSLDTLRSLAEVTNVSEDGLTYTIALRNRSWSDGIPITTYDIELWWRLILANKETWRGYHQGRIPDTITSLTIHDPMTFTVTTDKPYDPNWFIGNELAHVIPLPQHIWDPDNISNTPVGAERLYADLIAAAPDAKNKFLAVVSGPYKLDNLKNGTVTLTAVDKYDGLDRPRINTIKLQPTPDNDLGTSLITKKLDVTMLPSATPADQVKKLQGNGFTVAPQYDWGISYLSFNFNNKTSLPLLEQTYIRKSLQRLINQDNLIKNSWSGEARKGCDVLPTAPNTPDNPCPPTVAYDLQAAKQELAQHGWQQQGADMVCTESAKCGEGIAHNTKLAFTVIATKNSPAIRELEQLRDEFAQSGITLTINQVPDAVAVMSDCARTARQCEWDLGLAATPLSWVFPTHPSGEHILATNSAANFGGFSNPQADELIAKTYQSATPDSLATYSNFINERQPVLWLPQPPARYIAYPKNLTGVDNDSPLIPQNWSTP